MISVPLYVFLFCYFGWLIFLASFLLFNFAHLFHTGTLTLASFTVSFIFLALAALVLWSTWYLLQTTDWRQGVLLWDNAWFGNTFSWQQISEPFGGAR